MRVNVVNRANKGFEAEITSANKKELRTLSKEWRFNWNSLYSTTSILFKLTFENKIQGLIKLQEENDSYFVLKNIEVALSNYGSNGKFKNIAEILMSYACLKSFELNKGNYKGYLVFKSKGALIEYYQKKYQAELIFRERMIITPQVGKILIKKNLNIDLNYE